MRAGSIGIAVQRGIPGNRLAVGAGVMAAEAIGRNLMGGEHGSEASPHAAAPETHYAPPDVNADMGGQDFGIQDSGSWDSGGGDSWD